MEDEEERLLAKEKTLNETLSRTHYNQSAFSQERLENTSELPSGFNYTNKGFDVLSDYIREQQATKAQLKRTNMNFYNQAAYDRSLTKNAGGGGNFYSTNYGIISFFKKPSEIVREKKLEPTSAVTTPLHLKYATSHAN